MRRPRHGAAVQRREDQQAETGRRRVLEPEQAGRIRRPALARAAVVPSVSPATPTPTPEAGAAGGLCRSPTAAAAAAAAAAAEAAAAAALAGCCRCCWRATGC
eukprot:4087430-Pleurochrysis_carterae.AAC.1